MDCREYCSQACVIRMGYIISNCCCNILGIKRQIGHHYPKNHTITHRKTSPVFLNTTLPAAEEDIDLFALEEICRTNSGSDFERRDVITGKFKKKKYKDLGQ